MEVFPKDMLLGLFNVHLAHEVEGTGGIITNAPISYGQATSWIHSLLQPVAKRVPGFENVIDAWMEPVPGTVFASEEERDAWLQARMEAVQAGRRTEEAEMIATMQRIRKGGFDRDKALTEWINSGYDEKTFSNIFS